MYNIKRGKGELLNWLNEALETSYQKVEELADGIAYAQIFDACFPADEVPLHLFNFRAKHCDDYERNLKKLQKIVRKLNIPIVVPVNKLSRAMFIDHIDFLQWCYTYVVKNFPNALDKYHGSIRREQAMNIRFHKLNRKKNDGPVKTITIPIALNVNSALNESTGSDTESSVLGSSLLSSASSLVSSTAATHSSMFPEEYQPKRHSLRNLTNILTFQSSIPSQSQQLNNSTPHKDTKPSTNHPSSPNSSSPSNRPRNSPENMNSISLENLHSKVQSAYQQLTDSLVEKLEANQDLQEEIISLQQDRDELFAALRSVEHILARTRPAGPSSTKLYNILRASM